MGRRIFLISSIFILLFSSCKTKQNIVYFQNTNTQDSLGIANFEIKIKTGDILDINVFGVDEEFSKLFSQSTQNINGQPANYNNGVAARIGYLVDTKGYVNLPIVGNVYILGKTINEANTIITHAVHSVLTDAKVFIRLQNFKVTVLGDVKTPGTYTIPNERITLLEAIGISGDLNITGERKNVLVIRDVDGIKKQYRLDLTKGDVFSSEVYYLHQNDVVYVEPNRAKRNSSIFSSAAGLFISMASLLITTINAVTK